MRGPRSGHCQAVDIKTARSDGEKGNELQNSQYNRWWSIHCQTRTAIKGTYFKTKLTREKIPTNIAPCCTSKYLLFVMMGFWYHGILTDFMDRVRADSIFDDLQRGEIISIEPLLANSGTSNCLPSRDMRVHGWGRSIRRRCLLAVVHRGGWSLVVVGRGNLLNIGIWACQVLTANIQATPKCTENVTLPACAAVRLL